MPKNEAGPGAPETAPEDQKAAGKPTQKPGKAKLSAREERLAAALRANLRRRKAGAKKNEEDRD